MGPRTTNLQDELLQSIFDGVKDLTTTMGVMGQRLERLEANQTSNATATRDRLDRIERDHTELRDDFRKERELKLALERAELEREREEAKQQGEERGTNRANWAVLAAVAAAFMLVIGDIATHYFTHAVEPANVQIPAPMQLQSGPLGK